jgi:hypothetical protein
MGSLRARVALPETLARKGGYWEHLKNWQQVGVELHNPLFHPFAMKFCFQFVHQLDILIGRNIGSAGSAA